MSVDWIYNLISIIWAVASLFVTFDIYRRIKSKSIFLIVLTILYAIIVRTIYAFDSNFNTKIWLVMFWPLFFISMLGIDMATKKFINGDKK